MNHQEILEYWFSDSLKAYWFNSTQDIDNEISKKFLPVWVAARRHDLDDWLQTADGTLAMIIVLDQLPLNMFRDQADSFLTEKQSIDIAKEAIKKGYDKLIDKQRRMFMYLPFMHSEDIQNQNESVRLFKKSGLKENLKFAEHHRSIVERFGRFPHRNAILGRQSTEAEIAYLNSDEAFKG